MADELDWGDDARRVRPLPLGVGDGGPPPPPSEDRPWVVWTLAGLLVVAIAVWAAWPDDEGNRSTRRAAVATAADGTPATVAIPTVTAPAPTTTPPPPIITKAATVLGDMTWEQVRPAGGAAQWLTNPVWAGDEFLFLAGAERLGLHRSQDGLVWSSTPTDFEPSDVEGLQLVTSGDALVAYGYGFGRPRAWHSPDGRSWSEIDLPRPRPPTTGPLDIFWDPTVDATELPNGGAVVWSGAWIGIDWDGVLGAAFELFDVDSATGVVLVRETEDGPLIELTYSIEAADDSVHLTLRRTDDGELVHESVSVTGGFDAGLTAASLQPGGLGGVWRPAAWIVAADGTARFIEPDVQGLISGAASWITATDDGIVAGSTLIGDGVNQPPGTLVRSSDGVAWEVLPSDVLPVGALVAGAASDGDVMVLAGTMWRTVQLADQITARSQVAVSFRSEDAITWSEHDAGFPVGAFNLTALSGGPLGFAVVDLACPGVCSYQAWVSPDGTEWTRVTLPGAQLRNSFPILGVAVGTDAVVVLGADLDGFNVFSNLRVWAGTVDA